MIRKNKNLIFAIFQVVTPNFKSFNNSPEFLVISLIISLYQDHLHEEKSYRLLLPKIGSWLAQNITYDIVEKICFNLMNITIWIKMIEDKSFTISLSQANKGCLSFCCKKFELLASLESVLILVIEIILSIKIRRIAILLKA